MRKIKIVILFLSCSLFSTSQTFRDNYIGTYYCNYVYHQNSLIINGSKNIHIYEDPNSNDGIVIADSGWNPPSSYKVKLYSDSTFKDTILCSSGLCFYGKFHHEDSIFYHKVEYDDPPYYTEYFGIKVPSVGIKEYKTTMVIDAYPNPCSDRFSFRITEGVRPKSYSFFASDGRQMTFPKTVNEEFDVSAFPEGLYFLKIETGTGIITRKIIIQR